MYICLKLSQLYPSCWGPFDKNKFVCAALTAGATD